MNDHLDLSLIDRRKFLTMISNEKASTERREGKTDGATPTPDLMLCAAHDEHPKPQTEPEASQGSVIIVDELQALLEVYQLGPVRVELLPKLERLGVRCCQV